MMVKISHYSLCKYTFQKKKSTGYKQDPEYRVRRLPAMALAWDPHFLELREQVL